jgi:RNA polymerase sigma-70 factor (ECF subfamily)
MIGHSGDYYGVVQEQVAESRRGRRAAGPERKAQSDEALMAAYVAGDMSAFAELFRRYAPVLERVLWRSLRDEVADFVQQTFLHLHRARTSFTIGALFRPWLLSIAINLQREHFRRLKRRRAVHPDVFTFGSRAPIGPDVIYEAERACRAVESLPAREREVLELLCGAGLSTADIATEMGTTTAGVKSLAHRARQRLRASQ